MKGGRLRASNLRLDDHPVEPTNQEGRFVLENVHKGEHSLKLQKIGTWPRKYTFTVGKSDQELRPLSLAPLVTVRFIYDQGPPAATVQYRAYAWLLPTRRTALNHVRSVLYQLPVWVGKAAAPGARQPPFCYAVAGQVDFGFLGQHAADPVIATVSLRNGAHFKVAGLPNLPGEAHPNCTLSGGGSGGTGGGGTGGGGTGGGGTGGGGGNGGGGSTKRLVQNVLGRSFESAIATLQSVGFDVTRVDVASDKPKDVVVGQNPAGGTLQPPGTTITLRVSKGPATLITVPDVTGSSEAAATEKLEFNSFMVDVITQAVSDQSQDGIVLNQEPAGGTKAESGSTVKIVVGQY